MLQPSDHLSGSPLDPFPELHVLLVLGAPGLDAGLQMGPHKGRAEGDNHLPLPAGHPSFDTAQDTVVLLGCESSLLAHVQLFIHQDPQVLLCRAETFPTGLSLQLCIAAWLPNQNSIEINSKCRFAFLLYCKNCLQLEIGRQKTFGPSKITRAMCFEVFLQLEAWV